MNFSVDAREEEGRPLGRDEQASCGENGGGLAAGERLDQHQRQGEADLTHENRKAPHTPPGIGSCWPRPYGFWLLTISAVFACNYSDGHGIAAALPRELGMMRHRHVLF